MKMSKKNVIEVIKEEEEEKEKDIQNEENNGKKSKDFDYSEENKQKRKEIEEINEKREEKDIKGNFSRIHRRKSKFQLFLITIFFNFFHRRRT